MRSKLFEVHDAAVPRASGELLSGHTRKRAAAAFVALPVLAVLAAQAAGQNRRPTVVQAA